MCWVQRQTHEASTRSALQELRALFWSTGEPSLESMLLSTSKWIRKAPGATKWSACKNPVTTPTPRATYSLQRAIQHQSGFQISLECTSAAHPGSTQSQKNAKYTYSWHMGEAFGSALPCSPQFSKQKRYAFNPVSLTTWEILKVWFFFFKAESSSGYHFQSFCL